MPERLQKILARYGVNSRRRAEQMILAGRVRVNGEIVTKLGTTADPDRDSIEIDGAPLQPLPQLCYVLLHKPVGVICSRHDPQRRKTIYDLLPTRLHHLFYVGRLDRDSSGAVLLTNDGDLTYRWTHPRHHIPKHYQVWVRGKVSTATVAQWRAGVMLDDRLTLPADVEILDYQGGQTLLYIVLREGRNRQIRRVAALLQHPVVRLHRTQIGHLSIAGIPSGHYRVLSPSQILAI
ncbi:MAG: pseudouridine synthase [Pseudanabaenaceae cyanobacterium SKYGB_i_bin29]|nr:rRNA pseudouridine synthase [Pseudanabaenaceae cyanobacterium SKYG29]MDW8421605.1 pseudouridine synthase [Pseudanabaenaceae cyanobacterium SKYGB_i_bin29]